MKFLQLKSAINKKIESTLLSKKFSIYARKISSKLNQNHLPYKILFLAYTYTLNFTRKNKRIPENRFLAQEMSNFYFEHKPLIQNNQFVSKKKTPNTLLNKKPYTIGVFCEPHNIEYLTPLIRIYNQEDQNLNWILCFLDNHSKYLHALPEDIPYIVFSSIDDAMETSEFLLDIITDYDDYFKEIQLSNYNKDFSNHILNIFSNLSTLDISLYDLSLPQKLILDLKNEDFPITFNKTNSGLVSKYNIIEGHAYKYDIGFIGDNSIYSDSYLRSMSKLSEDYKIVFIGLSDAVSFSKRLEKTNWNLQNICFDYYRSRGELFENCQYIKLIIESDKFNNNIVPLSLLCCGVPFFTTKQSQNSHNLYELELEELFYESYKDICFFLRKTNNLNFKNLRKKILTNLKKSQYLNPKTYLTMLEKEMKCALSKSSASPSKRTRSKKTL